MTADLLASHGNSIPSLIVGHSPPPSPPCSHTPLSESSELSSASAATEPTPAASVFTSKVVPEPLMRSIQSTRVEYRRVGSSGLRVSSPILGTLGMGDTRWMDWVIDEAKASELLLAAYNAGINTWDTANAYSNGESELIIGRTIKRFNIPRHKLVLMTKVGRIVGDTDEGEFVAFLDGEVSKSKDYVNQYGLSRAAILTAVDQSLTRLQTSYIDVLHIHRWDPHTPIEETMSTLHGLVCAGKVRYLAASSMWAFQLCQLQNVAARHGWTGITAIQCHYNLIYREEEREMLKFCESAGIGVLSWAPLAEGYLARPLGASGDTSRSASSSRFDYGVSAADRETIARAESLAKKHNVAMSHVALAWLRKRVTSAIVGINSISRMNEIIASRDFQLTTDEDASLSEPYVPKAVQGHS